MRRQTKSLRSVTALLMVGGMAGGLSACGGGGGGGSSSPPAPEISGEALDPAITVDPPTTVPDVLRADGSGTPADNSMLEETADAARATIGGVWADIVYERTTASDSTDTFVIYSNKEAPEDTPFSDVYPFDHDADNDTTNDSLTVDMNNVEKITSVDNFPTAGARTEVQYSDGDDLTGTFAEALGTYTCVSACSLTADKNGNFVTIGGEWYFKPNSASDPVPVDDSDYIHFGYWLNEAEENDEPVIMAAAIAGGTDPSPIGAVQSLEGEASYTGAATGLYVIRTFSLDGEVNRRSGGQFTADAMLTAYFGGDDVAVNKHYTIVGTITDFKDPRGSAIDSSWSVDLEKALFGSQQSATFEGDTVGDADADRGDWEAQFFGPVAVDNDNTTPGNQSTLPSAVAGTFDAHFTNGAVIGSFGAEHDD